MTADELSNLPDGPFRHELVKGELLTMPLPFKEHGAISVNLTVALAQYVKANKLGVVYAEAGFKLESDPDTVLGPDVAFVKRERVGISKKYGEGAPDLAVEVISLSDRRQRIKWKTEQWLQFGAQSVWNVNPQTKTVSVYRNNGEVKHFSGAEVLTDDLLPGFQISLTEIFPVGNF
jgi:Uma2 family endonuclease